MIGLSLSLCIKDVIEGRMPVEAIDKIVAGTRFTDDASFTDVIDTYAETYWRLDPERGKRIARNLRELDLIEQPRLEGLSPAYLGDGHWKPSPTPAGKRPKPARGVA